MMKKLKLLVADDSIASRLRIKNTLKDIDDFQYSEAKNGDEVIDLLTKEHFDFLILDILMPGVSGFKVLESIKEQGLKLRTIVLTADTQTSTKRICYELGAENVVHKSITLKQLRNAVQVAINKMEYHGN